MQPHAIAHMGFDGVAKGVSKVEGGTHTRLAFIGADHFGLGRARTLNGGSQGNLIEATQGVHVVFQPGQERLVANQPVLDDFRQPCGQFAGRKGIEGLRIDQHQIGLIEGTDHVLAQRMVDPGFAAHGRINLREQGGWHLDKVDTALIASGGKPGHVTNHATTKGNHRGAPVMAGCEQAIENQLQGFPVFERFAIGQDDRQHRIPRQAAGQALKIEGSHGGVGHNRHLATGDVRSQQPRSTFSVCMNPRIEKGQPAPCLTIIKCGSRREVTQPYSLWPYR